ncbi:MAG TPA: OB-fold domain-containing protein [Acidimicrobiales bacterium]|nr:OB-fold domain-containing protein [Acidimicrobiales bacterium]
MRGILALGGYVPFRRLDRRAIAAVAGTGGGSGTRSVASYDEDTTTMGFEAARNALRASPGAPVRALWFATTTPAYADRTNATAVHAALRLDRDVVAADAAGAVRSSVAALRGALMSTEPALVVASDLRTGLPGSADEAARGDGAAAIAVGDGTDGEVLAEYIGGGSATEEFLDRWRAPGEVRSRLWEERFGEGRYTALGEEAWERALKATGVTGVDHLVVVSTHARATATLSKRLAGPTTTVADTLAATVGHTGAAHPLLVLTHVLEDHARVGQVVALVSLADGADVLLFRVRRTPQPVRSVAAQVAAGGPIGYGKYLSWRGMLTVEPPRRPEPARVSASAAGRSVEWKFGFVGSRDKTTGGVRMPPAVPGADPGEEWEPAPMADAQGTVATYTIDRLAYSPSPPVMFAVVDFDGGGRLPVELTDADPDEVAVGMRVEPTFRRLSSADGIHNYFWKARPVRA